VLPKRVSMAYNALGQRTQIARFQSTGTANPVATTDFTYDTANRLVRRHDAVVLSYTPVTYWVYDEGTNPLLEYLGGNPLIQHRYVWSNNVDDLLADEQNPGLSSRNTLWALSDHLGSIRDIADTNESTGATSIANHRRYDSFGRRVWETNDAVDLVFGYTGKLFDETTRLQNNLNRWYDSSTGRWISQDPIGFAAGDANLYRYVGNGPNNATDPSGLTEKTPEGLPRGTGGHHVVPWSRWKNLGLPLEVQKVFNQMIPHSVDHGWSKPHSEYNKRVGDVLDQWISKSGGVSSITPKMAQQFFDDINSSTDPYIRGFLDNIKSDKAKMAKWYTEQGSKILEDEAKTLSTLGKGAKSLGSIASKAGKVFKIISIGTAIYYVSEGGVVYAADKTVKDAIFFDEIAPYVKHVASIVDGELDAMNLRSLENRFRFAPEKERDLHLRYALRYYPDLHRLKYGCDPEPFN